MRASSNDREVGSLIGIGQMFLVPGQQIIQLMDDGCGKMKGVACIGRARHDALGHEHLGKGSDLRC